MAREHARILSKIWDDPDWRQRSSGAQRLYMQLLSQRAVNHAGVLPLTVKKWARGCEGLTPEDVWRDLRELDTARYVVVDTETEEVLIRSFIRNDGVAKQPNVLKAALRLASEVESLRLRAVLAGELRLLHHEDADRLAHALTGNPSGTPSEGMQNPSTTPDSPVDNPVDKNPSGTPRDPLPENAGEGERGISSSAVLRFKEGPRERAEPPPAKCPKHVDDPNDPPCRACRTAREAREDWDTEQATAERTEIRACRLCTTDGQRLTPGSRAIPMSPYVRCDHQPLPRQEPA